MHPFDLALQMQPRADGRLVGQASRDYWNVVGPYGGITAATAVQAVLLQPAVIGEPLALTANFVAPVRPGEFTAQVTLERSNRTTQHWHLRLLQPNPDGGDDVVLQAMVVMGVRRDVWSGLSARAPQVEGPEGLKRRRGRDQIAWFSRYDLRFVTHPFKVENPDEPIVHWVRDDPPRPLDHPALTAIADTFFPSIFAHRGGVVPVATVSMNVYFHCSRAELTALGAHWLIGEGRSNVFHEGFLDAEARLWAGDRLVATTHQVMWYRD
ncbi:MAG: thioesterase family protein [Burkholderiaceae bacterium]